MSPARRRKMVDRRHPSLSIVRQCALVSVSRSSLYYRPQGAFEEKLSLMGRWTGSTWRPPSADCGDGRPDWGAWGDG